MVIILIIPPSSEPPSSPSKPKRSSSTTASQKSALVKLSASQLGINNGSQSVGYITCCFASREDSVLDFSTEVVISTMSTTPIKLKSPIAKKVKIESLDQISVYRYGLSDKESLLEVQELISTVVANLTT